MKYTKLSPNAVCPCGSGKKHKRCCMPKSPFYQDEQGHILRHALVYPEPLKATATATNIPPTMRDAIIENARLLFGDEFVRNATDLLTVFDRFDHQQRVGVLLGLARYENSDMLVRIYEETGWLLLRVAGEAYDKLGFLIVPSMMSDEDLQATADIVRDTMATRGKVIDHINVVSEDEMLLTVRSADATLAPPDASMSKLVAVEIRNPRRIACTPPPT
jgi:hypothetical protein